MTPEQKAVVDRIMGLAENLREAFKGTAQEYDAAESALRSAIEELAQQVAEAQRRCIDARNRLNAALHGPGDVIDDLEQAVENAVARLDLGEFHRVQAMDEEQLDAELSTIDRAFERWPLKGAALASQPLVPAGWQLCVQEDEEQSWLHITGPGSASVGFSAERGSLRARLLQAFGEALAASPAVQEAPAAEPLRSLGSLWPNGDRSRGDLPPDDDGWAPAAEHAADVLGVPASPSGSVVASLPSIPDATCGMQCTFSCAAHVAEVHMSRYTIEWTNGPLPEGTALYVKERA